VAGSSVEAIAGVGSDLRSKSVLDVALVHMQMTAAAGLKGPVLHVLDVRR
jgi:hypothetical protein